MGVPPSVLAPALHSRILSKQRCNFANASVIDNKLVCIHLFVASGLQHLRDEQTPRFEIDRQLRMPIATRTHPDKCWVYDAVLPISENIQERDERQQMVEI